MNNDPIANALAVITLLGFVAAAWAIAPWLTRQGFRPRVTWMDELMERVETRSPRPKVHDEDHASAGPGGVD